MATPHRTASFSAILQQLVVRLNTVLGRTEPGDTFVRVVIAPTPDFTFYRAEPGVHLVVYPPAPAVPGSGRYATKVQREVLVHVVSLNLSDMAGSDLIACLAHLDLEDQVVDAIVNFHPDVVATPGTAVNVRWKPGAQQQHRMTKQGDAGEVYSSLAFDITYAHPFTIPAP